MSGDPAVEKASLFGMVSFRPRLAIVLVFLTVTVAVVGYRFSQDTGSRRIEGLASEATRLFHASSKEGRKGPPSDPAEIEERISGWIGAKVALPRDEKLFSYGRATREKVGRQAAAAVRFTFTDEPCLLLIARPDPVRGSDASSSLFTESSFLSWEKEGMSFVSWERDGLLFFLVSGGDLTHTFDLVRQYFT